LVLLKSIFFNASNIDFHGGGVFPIILKRGFGCNRGIPKEKQAKCIRPIEVDTTNITLWHKSSILKTVK